MADPAAEERKRWEEAQGFVETRKYPGGLSLFGSKHGYLEATVRGFRSGFLTEAEYRQLSQCETLDDFKLCFQETDFADILSSTDLSVKLTTQVIVDRVWDKFLQEFDHLRSQATGELMTFLHYIQYEYMIKNVSYIISGLIKHNDPYELLADCLPMGNWPGMRAVLRFENGEKGFQDLFDTVLVDTPIGKYFEHFFRVEEREANREGGPGSEFSQLTVFTEQDIDLITDRIIRYWLEDFYRLCQGMGEGTAEIMSELLEFEADKRAISIMVNSFNTSLNEVNVGLGGRSTRQTLFCSFGKLYPEGIREFETCHDIQKLKEILSSYRVYADMWNEATRDVHGDDIADALQQQFEMEEVRLNVLAFESQAHMAVFYAFCKLKDYERRNIYWTAECIAQKKREEIESKLLPLFKKS